MANSRSVILDDENQYRSQLEKESGNDKLKIISEDFIDKLIEKRNKMNQNKTVKSYNDQTKQIRSNSHMEQRIPNVASISNKRASKNLHNGAAVKHGAYSFNTTAKKDMKTLNVQRNKAIEEYRRKIEATMKLLVDAQRKPVKEQEKFTAQIAQLKKELSEIE